jgi:opacity protein-like surface antigen
MAAIAFAALVVVLLTPAMGFGAESFTLTIPNRLGDRVPISLVKIMLEFPVGTDLSTLQLSIQEMSPPPNDVTLVTLATITATRPNSDFVSLIEVTSASKPTVYIKYTPKSMWTSVDPGTDRCNPKGAAPDLNVVMTLTGPTVSAYRMNTYTVPREESIASGSPEKGPCDVATRRIKSSAATIGLSLDPSRFKGRLPLDVVLVLDKSGSMFSPPDGEPAGSTSKWSILNDSIQQFVNLWTQADDALGTISPGGTLSADAPQDRLAVVFFSSSAQVADLDNDPMNPPVVVFVKRGTDGTTNWLPVTNAVGSESPGGSTAMGQGLKEGIDKYLNDPLTLTDAKNDATIILMTDALQNVNPLITESSTTGVMELAPLLGPCLKAEISSCHIPIQTFGFTTPGSAVDTLLNNISTQTSGHSIIEWDGMLAPAAFANMLIQSLKGNTLSLLSRTRSTLPAGTNASAPVQVLLDGSVRRATFVLGWVGGSASQRLDLEITGPDGKVVKPVLLNDGSSSTVQSVDLPTSGPIGDWSVKVLRKTIQKVALPAPDSPNASANVWPGDVLRKMEERETSHALAPLGTQNPAQATSPQSPPFPYHLSIYSVEGKLDYRLSFPSLDDGTGDTMTMVADVSYEGKSLGNLPNKAIKLKIERPPKGLGTILHDTDVQGGVLTTEIAQGGDSTTAYDRKLAALANGNGLGESRPKELGDEFFLEDKGDASSGDKTANDGLYAARFADTSRPGLYRFKITMDWDDPRTGRIHRIETIERVVKVNSDPSASKATVTSLGKGAYDIKVIPVDKFGNFFGPSNANPVTVKVTGGGNVASINDPNQKGEYIIHLENVPAGADPHITIVVDGRTIKDTTLSNLPGGGTGGSGGGGPMTKFAVFLHFGAAFPHGNFNNVFDPGFSFNGGLEYAVTDYFSVEGIFGAHRFENSFVGGNNVDLFQFSGNGKFYLSAPGTVRPWFNFGVGAYKFDPGSTRFGGNVGTGLQFNLTQKFALEAAYNFHAVSTTGTSTRFSTLQGGFRFRF